MIGAQPIDRKARWYEDGQAGKKNRGLSYDHNTKFDKGFARMSHPYPDVCARVTVVMAVLNEAQFIEETLASLQAQSTRGFDLEILVVDGMSQDDTRDKVAALATADPRIKLMSNPSGHTPAAFNIGLRAASGKYVCIMGAHAAYDRDYIAVCLEELLAHDAVGCSGKVVTAPANNSLQARLVAWAAGHPFASSSRSVRTQPEGFADTVPFPVMRKQALLDLGGYNERLLRNQDNDMNQRLRAQGFQLYVTGRTRCRYFARPSVASFLQYGFRSGLWNAFSLKQNPASLGLRHLAPLGFVGALFALLATFLMCLSARSPYIRPVGLTLLALVATHLAAGTLAGLQVAVQQKTLAALWLAPLILGFHCAYGLGTLRGLLPTSEFPAPVRLTAAPHSPRDPL